MPIMAENPSSPMGPKPRETHPSYNENVDEPAKLIDDEAVEIEREVPPVPNETVEGIRDDDTSKPPVFEE